MNDAAGPSLPRVAANAASRPRMTVAYVISTLDTGGAEVQLVNVVNALPPEIDPVVFVLRDALALRDRITNPRARVHVVGLRARWDVLGWLELGRELRRLKPSVVHSHMLLSNLAVRGLSPLCGIRRVINHEHGLSAWKGRTIAAADRATQRLADVIIVVSEASRKVRVERSNVPADRFAVLPNPIDCAYWSAVTPAPAGEFSTWGIAARLSWVKRIEIAIRMLDRARSRGNRHRLVIAGDGPERAGLEALVRELELEDSVDFLGEISDMRGFYSRIDALLLTSSSEDCPMTVLEGLASGKFVAATPVGGVPELLAGMRDGCLIEDEDEALGQLMQVPAGFDSPSNRQLAQRFDVRSYVERLLELYDAARA